MSDSGFAVSPGISLDVVVSATDEHGHFSLRGLNPGKYTVLAFEELPEDFRTPNLLTLYGGRGEDVESEEGTRRSVVVKLIPADAD